MTNRDRCLMLNEQGVKQAEIARIVGVSRQRVSQICGKYAPGHFIYFTEEKCVYPIWRQWMNDNRISRSELIRRMGLAYNPRVSAIVGNWMLGKYYPQKSSIDKLIKATGLTYEQLFYQEA